MAAWWPLAHLNGLTRQRQAHILKELPFLLDLATLCVEAGLNLHGALQQAARHGPPGALRDELLHALSDMRAGMPRNAALAAMSERCDVAPITQLVPALAHAEQFGMSLGPLLRSQAEQQRKLRFLRAEKLALEAPVKMLFPMAVCIFPCT